MRAPGVLRRHPELRWLASVALVVLVVVAITSAITGVFRRDSVLAATNPGQLISQVLAPQTAGYSGTIDTRVDLELPASMRTTLEQAAPVGGALLTGSHTMRYWYGGPDQQRVAVVEPGAEQDVFRDGRQLLLWDTRTQVAQHETLSSNGPAALALPSATPAALTPPQLAGTLLRSAAHHSDTTLRSGARVANRATYELLVEPDSSTSRIAAIRIEIDGLKSVPLRVEVYARGQRAPAVDVSFSAIAFAQPSGQNFSFSPPPGAQVRSTTMLGPVASALGAASVVGTGWSQLASYRLTTARAALVVAALGSRARQVKGSWGRGRLLQLPMLTVLVTDNGRAVAGAVDASVLYRAITP